MKIEIGESLCYSYLRHVKRCWLVQANWKVSEHWSKYKADTELEKMFQTMKQKFDEDGTVFKQTKNAGQFVKQGEIDVIGIEQAGSIHALDVAFHESGLNYGGGSNNRVLKKLLRTYLILHTYSPPETKFHIYFVSPKVNPSVKKQLNDTFNTLRQEYPETEWTLIINDDFTDQILQTTLEKADTVADTSELFVRASKLLELGIPKNKNTGDQQKIKETPVSENQLQPIVKSLMETLLMEVLDDEEKKNLMDNNYCKKDLNLKIGNHALLRKKEDGRKVGKRDRYYTNLYADEFYVCTQWGKKDHLHNAKSLLKFICTLAQRQWSHKAILIPHIKELTDYVSN